MSSPDLSRRSHLFAPASNERIVRKALDSDSDAVVLDLEDSIRQSERGLAHDVLLAAARSIASRPTHLRIGIIDGRYAEDDVAMAARLEIEAVRLPKVEAAGAVAAVAHALQSAGSSASIHLTIESAKGLVRLKEVAAVSERISRVVFGERDFLADLGVDEPGPITDHARGEIAIVSRSEALGRPIDGAFIDLEDTEGLRRSCERARAFGFGGKSALHPKQLGVIHDVFSPSAAEVERASALVAAFDAARRRGEVMAVVDGRFVDEAVARRARSVLEQVEGA